MYQLVDFGNGRKLERFGDWLIDRPCPAAENHAADGQWAPADGFFRMGKGHRGQWQFKQAAPQDWTLPTCFGQMQLFPTDFGHLGVFVEQQQNWKWLGGLPLSGLRLLNLFAYTGGSTLAAAFAGAEVTHIDSAKNIVRRASENALASGLQDRTIRWIVEDARKFVLREGKRGNRYDGVIFDPPSYGHGASSGTTWQIENDLNGLVAGLREIVPACRLMLFTCHSPGFTGQHMRNIVSGFCNRPGLSVQTGAMNLETESGRQLPCGNFVRWFDE